MEKGGGGKWARKCWEEVKKRKGRRLVGVGGARSNFYRARGVSVGWVRRKRERGEEVEGWLKERDVEMQERFERVVKSRNR